MDKVFSDGCQHIVVQRLFKIVVILAFCLQQAHFTVPEHITNGCTGFQIGIVGQVVILVKPLNVMPGTNAAADMKLLLGNVLPNRIQRLNIVLPVKFIGHCRSAGVA